VADFAALLKTRDLVFEGRVASADTVRRRPSGGCGVEGLSPIRGIDVVVRVDRVLVGVADDSMQMFTTIGVPRFASDSELRGDRVLAWGTRDCNDGWRLWGWLFRISSDGQVIPSFDDAILLSQEPIETLDAALQSGPKDLRQLVEEADRVVLVRATGTLASEPEHLTVPVELVGSLHGPSGRALERLTFPKYKRCLPRIEEGDTLVVPYQNGNAATLTLEVCPRLVRVMNGFASGFGVPLELLECALERTDGGRALRNFVAKGPAASPCVRLGAR
jgi:hypothetical protein